MSRRWSGRERDGKSAGTMIGDVTMVTRHGLNSNSGAVSVVMACYSMERLRGIVAAVHSIAAQTLQPAEIIVAVDHNRSLAHTLRREMPGICVLIVIRLDSRRRHSGLRDCARGWKNRERPRDT